MKKEDTEFWLQGALPDIPALLQPIAHALLQAQKEIKEIMYEFPEEKLWDQPAQLASPAFHLQHIVGVLNRLFTYADGKMLTDEQLMYLSAEGKKYENITVLSLINNLDKQVDASVSFLKQTNEKTLTQTRYVGRKQIPSTVLGLLFHAAEHTMRHNGQLQVTVKIILDKED